jgi:hypothetical protein
MTEIRTPHQGRADAGRFRLEVAQFPLVPKLLLGNQFL